MRGAKLVHPIAVIALLASTGVMITPQPTNAITCTDVHVVWARGTGAPEQDAQGDQFITTDLGGRIAESGATMSQYRLGTGSGFGGFDYPAYGSPFDLLVSGYLELGGPYSDSVAQGHQELVAYMADRAAACPNETFVLGGWSQGAQVVGEGLFDLTPAVRSRIAFIALFGDPKRDTGNYLPIYPTPPEAHPASCEGHPKPWIRGDANCGSFGGIFHPRNPYVPADIENRVGSWCRRQDSACEALGGGLDEHFRYFDPGSDSLVAAREAALALRNYLPQFDFDVSWYPFAVGLGGADLGFVFDTTGSMSSHIANAKSEASDLAQAWIDLFPTGRVGLVEFKDQGDPFVSRVDLGLTGDVPAFQSAVNALTASGGGDTPEAALSGAMTALNQLDWHNGATKVLVVITDAPGKDPEPVTGFTTQSTVQRALEIDPVAVYTVNVANLAEVTNFFTPLANGTSAQVLTLQPGQTLSDALLDVIEVVSLDPVATLNGPYYAPVGTAIQFDTYPSFDPDSDLVSFEWDFDGNGTVDQTTATGSVAHTYTSTFHGLAVVRAISADGGSALASASVNVDSVGLANLYPLPPTSASATVTGSGQVTVTWTPAANDRAVDYNVSFENGLYAGHVAATDPHSMVLTGLDLTTPTKFYVNASNLSGQSALVATPTVGGSGPWGSVSRVNDDATTLHQVAPAVALGPNGAAIAAWQDYRASPPGNPTSQIDIYASRRDPTTGTWNANVRVNDVATGQQYKPSVAVGPNNDAYAVWVDNRNSRPDIYFSKRSAATGVWSPNVRVNSVTSFQSQDYPAIAVSPSGDAIAVWYRAANNKLNIWSARLAAGASTWGPEIRVTSSQTNPKQEPEVAFGPNGTAHAVWMDPAAGNADIWYASVPAGSSTWSAATKVSDDPGTAFQGTADIAVDGSGNVTVVWTDRRATPYQLRARRLPSGGTWAPSVVVAADGGNSPSLTVRTDGRAYVAWHNGDFSTIFPRVYCSMYNPSTGTWSTPERIDTSPADHGAATPALALDATRLVALWRDAIDDPSGNTNGDIFSRVRTP